MRYFPRCLVQGNASTRICLSLSRIRRRRTETSSRSVRNPGSPVKLRGSGRAIRDRACLFGPDEAPGPAGTAPVRVGDEARRNWEAGFGLTKVDLPSGSAGSARRSTRPTICGLRAVTVSAPTRELPPVPGTPSTLLSVLPFAPRPEVSSAQSTVTIPVVRGVGRARLSVVLKVVVEDVLYVKLPEAGVPEYSLSMRIPS